MQLLEQIEEEYGDFLKSLGNDMLVGFVKENCEICSSSSFDNAIKYAKSIVKENDCINENHIIGIPLNKQNIL